MTILSLLIAVPFGIFSAIFLVEYSGKGNKFVEVIRLTTETLSGIPSIVYGLFGMLFFVNTLDWGFSILAGAFTSVSYTHLIVDKETFFRIKGKRFKQVTVDCRIGFCHFKRSGKYNSAELLQKIIVDGIFGKIGRCI